MTIIYPSGTIVVKKVDGNDNWIEEVFDSEDLDELGAALAADVVTLAGNQTISGTKTFDSSILLSSSGVYDLGSASSPVSTIYANSVEVQQETYGVSWSGSVEVPTKDDLYDKIETLGGGGGGGETVTEVTGTSQTAAGDNSYITNNASLVTITLPSSMALGEKIRVIGKGAGGWKIAQNAGQVIYFGSSATTSGTGGSLASNNQRDVVEIMCTTADTDFTVISSIGNMTLT
jgi:hypothetical protein